MKKLALAACLIASVAALSACESTSTTETRSTEMTTHGSTVMEKSVTK